VWRGWPGEGQDGRFDMKKSDKNGTGEMPVGAKASKTGWKKEALAELAELEAQIGDAELSFVNKGKALKAVWKKGHHITAGYKSFEEYAETRWEMSRSRAYRLMDAADAYDVVANLATVPLPLNEAQCRELAKLKDEKDLDKQAKRQREAWAFAVKLCDGKRPTQSVVAEAVRHVLGKPKPVPLRPAIVALRQLKSVTRKVVEILGGTDLDEVEHDFASKATVDIRRHIHALTELAVALEGATDATQVERKAA